MKLLRFLIMLLVGFCIFPTLSANTSIDSLETLLENLSDEQQRVEVMLELGKQLEEDSPKRAVTYFNAALRIVEAQKNDSQAFELYGYLGELYDKQGRKNKAISLYRKAAETAERLKDRDLQTIAYLRVGENYTALDKHDVAIIYYIKTKRIYEMTNNRLALANILKRIGEGYQARERMDAAIQYNLSALEIFRAFSKSRELAEVLNNMGDLHFDNSEYDKAADYYKQSIGVFQQLGLAANFVELHRLLGESQKLIGEDTAAKESFEKAEKYLSTEQLEEGEVIPFRSSDNLEVAETDTNCLEETVDLREAFPASDSSEFWMRPSIDNKPNTTQTIAKATNSKTNAARTLDMAIGKLLLLGISVLSMGILIGFLWCIRQYKRKWEELQKYMEDKDEKLLQQSHEIKTLEKELKFFNQALYKGLQMPATDVKVTSNLLKEKYNGSLDKEGSKYIRQIQKSATSLEGLLTAIFNFQQIKHYGLRLKNIDVSRMAKTITAELKNYYPKREIRFWVQEDMEVQADEELVRLMLANLLQNAIKFTQKNPIAIIEFGKKEHVFYIKDNGEGFHPQEAKLLFETFEPLKHTKNFEELTVSLLSMQTIVQKHGGTIWTVSQEGKGTTFFFTLDATPVKNGGKDFWNLSKSPHFKFAL